jgi:hypothetical protein
MTSALVTRGLESFRPATVSAGASGVAVPFQLRNSTTGDLESAVDLSAAGVVQVSTNGAAFADRVGAAPTSITGGDGSYYYVLDNTEVIQNWVWLKVRKVGYDKVDVIWNISDAATETSLDDAITTLANAITAARDSINGNVDTRASQVSVDALPTDEEIDTHLSAVHGSGSWEGSSPDDIDALLSDVHGSGSWEGSGLDGAAVATAVWGAVGEAPHTYGDLLRGAVGALVGPATDYETGTIVVKNITGTKTRWTILTDDSGRLSCVAGDLT